MGNLTLISSDVVTDGNDPYRLASPVINGTRIDEMCKGVLNCAIEAKTLKKCEDCNHSIVCFNFLQMTFSKYYICKVIIVLYIQQFILCKGYFGNKQSDESCVCNLGLVYFPHLSWYLLNATGCHCADLWSQVSINITRLLSILVCKIQ